MVRNSVAARILAAVMLCVVLASCGGSSTSSKSSSASQGFIPAPAQGQTATRSARSTATTLTASPSPSSVASVPTPTPVTTPDVAASAQANGCPVTPFDKSGPPNVKALLYPQWYGSGNLWFAPPSYFAGSGLQQLGNSSVWFQGIVPAMTLATETPKITGHLQSDPATTLTTTPGSTSELAGSREPVTPTPPESAHGVNIGLPKPGCWQLSVTSGSQKLDVTIWVVPITQRPDYRILTNIQKSLTPYPPPASCAVTSWNGPYDHSAAYSADYWITGQGLILESNMPVFFPTQSAPLNVYGNFPNQPNVTGRLTGNTTGVLRSSWIEHASGSGQSGWQGSIIYSNPGCWNLSITDGSAKVDMTIYVYPDDCYHLPNQPKPASCKAPV